MNIVEAFGPHIKPDALILTTNSDLTLVYMKDLDLRIIIVNRSKPLSPQHAFQPQIREPCQITPPVLGAEANP